MVSVHYSRAARLFDEVVCLPGRALRDALDCFSILQPPFIGCFFAVQRFGPLRLRALLGPLSDRLLVRSPGVHEGVHSAPSGSTLRAQLFG